MLRAHRPYQVRVFALTWLSYASYYLTRKNFSVVKSRINSRFDVSVEMLGMIDTLYLAAYSFGQFVNGALGDRFGPRRVIALGMLASAAASCAFGFGTTAAIFLVAFGLNGYFQSTGWPNNVKAMTPWFGRKSRGKVMGFWCTNFQVGSLVATPLAALLLMHVGWRAAFFVPAVWVVFVGVLVLLFLVEQPEDRGLPAVDPQETSHDNVVPAAGPPRRRRAPFLDVLADPVVWSLSASYFGVKLIRYSLWFWLPFYLHRKLGYGEGEAGFLSVAFDAGGILGAIATGWISDRFFPYRRGLLLSPMLFGLAGALWLYQIVGTFGWFANAAAMALTGFLLFGPDALISGAAAQDAGGTRGAGSAAGIINGIGSLGAVLQGLIVPRISEAWGWHSLFYLFIVMAIVSGCALLPLAVRRTPPHEPPPAD